MFKRTAAIFTLIGISSAQFAGLTSSCTSALTSIVVDPGASACLSPGSLIGLATSSGNTSVVGPINAWLGNVCSAAPCSNETLANIVTIVANGCQEDLSVQGQDPTRVAASITPIVQQYYPTVREILCLREGEENCVTQTLTNIESVQGPLTLNDIINMLLTGDGLQNLPPNVTCTDCGKAAYNLLAADVSFLVQDTVPALQAQCGASFTDGNTPSTITQGGTSDSANTTNNNGGSTLTTGLVFSSLAVTSIVSLLL